MSVSYVKLHSRGRRGFAFGAIGAESGAAMTWQDAFTSARGYFLRPCCGLHSEDG